MTIREQLDRSSEIHLTANDLQRALRLRRANLTPVDQPLVLISQAQRSGGTLLARLFDGHPSCHVHPHELHIGDRRRHTWPALSLDEVPEEWFAKLEERDLATFFQTGRRMTPLKARTSKPGEIYYPFMLPPSLQRRIFLDEVEGRGPITSRRQILDCYMTSLFNAWLDNQNLRGTEKRWVVAFSPRRAWGERLDEFFDLYPDGRLISILRDPLSWYASARGRSPGAEAGDLLETWKRSADEMLNALRCAGTRICVVRFEDLVLETRATMRVLAEFLEIEFDPQLILPTFNRYPMGTNSSFDVPETGVVAEAVDRYRRVLSPTQQELVRRECDELYEAVVAAIGAADREPSSPDSTPVGA